MRPLARYGMEHHWSDEVTQDQRDEVSAWLESLDPVGYDGRYMAIELIAEGKVRILEAVIWDTPIDPDTWVTVVGCNRCHSYGLVMRATYTTSVPPPLVLRLMEPYDPSGTIHVERLPSEGIHQ